MKSKFPNLDQLFASGGQSFEETHADPSISIQSVHERDLCEEGPGEESRQEEGVSGRVGPGGVIQHHDGTCNDRMEQEKNQGETEEECSMRAYNDTQDQILSENEMISM